MHFWNEILIPFYLGVISGLVQVKTYCVLLNNNLKYTYCKNWKGVIKMTITLRSKADHVGSLLRTERLKQARIDFENKKIDQQQLTAVEDEEIEKIVIKQMEGGLKSITDGEFRRAWWHLDFLSSLHGVEEFEAEYVSS